MNSLELLTFIVGLIFLPFILGYHLAYFNKKSKSKEKFSDKLEVGERFATGLLIYIPLALLLYVIFALELNLSPNGAIIYQNQGGLVYYISNMITTIPNFITYLASTANGFFYNIILLILLPIVTLIIFRYFVSGFSGNRKEDFVAYTKAVFIPLLTVIFAYLLAILFSPKYGIYFSQTNYSSISIGFLVLVLGIILLLSVLEFFRFLIKLIGSKRFTIIQKMSPYLIIIILTIIYSYYYIGNAFAIYNQPSLTNISITKTGWGEQLTGNIVLNSSTPILEPIFPSQMYFNITQTIVFNGVDFIVLPVNRTDNLSLIRNGILPLGSISNHKNVSVNYTLNYTTSNPFYYDQNPNYMIKYGDIF